MDPPRDVVIRDMLFPVNDGKFVGMSAIDAEDWERRGGQYFKDPISRRIFRTVYKYHKLQEKRVNRGCENPEPLPDLVPWVLRESEAWGWKRLHEAQRGHERRELREAKKNDAFIFEVTNGECANFDGWAASLGIESRAK